MKESAQKILTSGDDLENMANQSSQTSNDICLAVDEISKGALSQAEDVEQATQQISDIGTLIKQIVRLPMAICLTSVFSQIGCKTVLFL